MNKKIVITGASSEIGIAICKQIIKNGDEVILQVNKNELGLNSIISNNKNVKVIKCDFTDFDELKKFCELLDDIDILINIAAVTLNDLLVNLSDENILQMINVNILSLTQICKKVIPSMVVKKKGCIVNFSSVAAQRGNRGQSVYAGTKGFIESFTRSLAAEYGKKGIRVNAVAPGPIESGSLTELLNYAKNEIKNSVVAKRLGTPEDVANTVEFLVSDKSEFINGKIIQVDGGFCQGV